MREPCQSGIRTIHVDPDRAREAMPRLSRPTSTGGLRAVPADRLRRVLLRLPRRSTGSASTVARQGRLRLDRGTPLTSLRALTFGRYAAPERPMTDRLFVNASQVVTCAGPARARRGGAMRDAGDLAHGRRGHSKATCIAGVGPEDELRAPIPGRRDRRLPAGRPHAGIRGFAHARDLRRGRATRSMRCARRAWTTWRSRARGGGIHASVRDVRAHGARTSWSRWRGPGCERLAATG